MSDKVQQLIRKEILQLNAYHVPDPGDMIKLDAMENPYHMPEALINEWAELIKQAEINRYPDPAATKLSASLMHYMEVPENISSPNKIILGNGSDELIQILAMSVAQSGRKILAPTPGFVMYEMIATFAGLGFVGVPLNEDFSLHMSAMLEAIERHQPALIFLAYPNNPTGNLFSDDEIEQILNKADGLVIVDEAYHPFACKSFMPRLGEFDNLLVMRTVSKMGLAGLRLGVLAGPEQWISEFDKIRLPYNINVLTQLTAEFALKHADVFEQQAKLIRQQRDWLFKRLSEFSQFKVFPSKANFILLRVLQGNAVDIFAGLKQRGILIKNSHSAGGVLTQCLRVTVGTPDENEALITAIKSVLSGHQGE